MGADESQIEETLKVKFPPDIKRWLKVQAAKNVRSMTAEVVLAVIEKRERIESQERDAHLRLSTGE